MLAYFLLLFLFPFIELKLFPLILFLLAVKSEIKGIGYQNVFLPSLALSFIPSLIISLSLFPYYFSYISSIFIVMKIIFEYPYSEKKKAILSIFGERLGKEVLFLFYASSLILEKVKRIYITYRIRGFRVLEAIRAIVKLVNHLDKKAKRLAITKSIREG